MVAFTILYILDLRILSTVFFKDRTVLYKTLGGQKKAVAMKSKDNYNVIY